MYTRLRSILFLLDPEKSHRITGWLLTRVSHYPLLLRWLTKRVKRHHPSLPCQVMGLQFPNPIGLAAGFDKDARFFEATFAMGFGFVETGTVTPRPQAGNPLPRLFRLPAQQAIINRMGFNSAGLDAFCHALQQRICQYPLGANLGKNRDTPMAGALQDYLRGLDQVAAHADYATINISSPNTSQLRELQQTQALRALLQPLLERRDQLAEALGRALPLVVKIAPDLDDHELHKIAEVLLELAVDGVIATNTTVNHHSVRDHPMAAENGGLSGHPLFPQSLRVVHSLFEVLQGQIPIIGVGGIDSPQRAWDMLLAGADLLQIYSALIYQGPALIGRILQFLEQKRLLENCTSLAETIVSARAKRSFNGGSR